MSTPIPVVPRFETEIGRRERGHLEGLADRMLAAEPALAASSAFGDLVTSGLHTTPRLLIGDQSEIPLFASAEEAYYGYRVGLLADEGDLVALAQERSLAFEHYLKRLLGIKELEILDLAASERGRRSPLPLRCLESPAAFHRIVSVAKSAGGLNLVPHLTTGHVWRLAQAVADDTGNKVAVCGPPPRLSKRVNDKLWFAACVREVLGQTSLPPTYSAYGPAALAAHVRHLAKRYERVVVKVPDSAGSAGNLPLVSSSLTGMSLAGVRERLLGLLGALGWSDRYPLMVEVWDTDVISSPSVQMWIPETSKGESIIEGIFEQVVEGLEGNFVGAVRSRLPGAVRDRLVDEAARLAFLFQKLGYFGRCSPGCGDHRRGMSEYPLDRMQCALGWRVFAHDPGEPHCAGPWFSGTAHRSARGVGDAAAGV